MTRTEAINAKCKDCIYDNEERGTWREQCTACNQVKCPLYPFRPLAEGIKRSEAIESDKVLAIRERIGGY